MFDSLSEKLQGIISKTRGKELTQDNMQEALREIRRALLEADVNLRVVKSFISSIKDKAEGEKVLEGVDPSQQLVKIVHDELLTLLSSENEALNLNAPAPACISTGCLRDRYRFLRISCKIGTVLGAVKCQFKSDRKDMPECQSGLMERS